MDYELKTKPSVQKLELIQFGSVIDLGERAYIVCDCAQPELEGLIEDKGKILLVDLITGDTRIEDDQLSVTQLTQVAPAKFE